MIHIEVSVVVEDLFFLPCTPEYLFFCVVASKLEYDGPGLCLWVIVPP